MELAKQLRKRIADGDAVFGTFVAELKAAGVVTVLADNGLDFFMVDGEHGCYSTDQIATLISTGKQAVAIDPAPVKDIRHRTSIT